VERGAWRVEGGRWRVLFWTGAQLPGGSRVGEVCAAFMLYLSVLRVESVGLKVWGGGCGVEGGRWRVEGGGWRVEGERVTGDG